MFFRYVPRSGIAGSYGSSIFNFSRNLHYGFHSGYTNLHSPQQCTSVSFSPHPWHLSFVFILLIASLTDVQWQLTVILTCTSLMISPFQVPVGHLHFLFGKIYIHFFCPLFPLRGKCECSPLYHKLCSWVSHVWRNQRGQHTPSAMGKSHLGQTTFVIMVTPMPGKYPIFQFFKKISFCMSYVYAFNINPLFVISFAKIFFHSLSY